MNIQFGAIYLRPEVVSQLSNAKELGYPRTDFIREQPFKAIEHARLNGTIGGAISVAGRDIGEVRVGSYIAAPGADADKQLLINEGQQGAAIFATRADMPAGEDPAQHLNRPYNSNDPGEKKLVEALNAAGIPHEQGPFKTFYKRVFTERNPFKIN